MRWLLVAVAAQATSGVPIWFPHIPLIKSMKPRADLEKLYHEKLHERAMEHAQAWKDAHIPLP